MSWFEGTRARLRLLFSRRAAESRMEEEIGFHIDMEAERLVREAGLDTAEARRRAFVAFGGVERTREELREGRGLAWLTGLRLDLKLGARMLVKYPVLTLASVLALAAAIALAVSWFQFSANMALPRIPLPEADRLVALRNLDLETTSTEPRSLADFEAWRRELRSIQELSAAAPQEYNATTDDGRFGTLNGARVTGAFFQLTRVQPLFGRALTDADDRPGAPLVAVLGYAAWQRLFDGDRSVIGRTLRVGATYATVVGVMPEGFGFPLNQELWTPLRESALSVERREGPSIRIYGRLAPGVSLDQARAELTAAGERSAAAFPDTHARLRPEIRRFGTGGGGESGIAAMLNLPFLIFLLVVSANVATLLFARTATRENEIALRSALGASRRRIVVQLAAEALVLTSTAAVLALAVANWGLHAGMDLFWDVQQMRPPFWWRPGLSLPGALYVCALAVVGAVIIGAIPGLRATRRQLRSHLAHPGAGGAGMRFGAVATGVIMLQVALCVAFIPLAIMRAREALQDVRGNDFPAGAYLTGRLTRQLGDAVPTPKNEAQRRAAELQTGKLFDEVHRRLAAEPGVVAATRSGRLPGFNHPMEGVRIEGDTALREVREVGVDPNFFAVTGARIVAGRAFTEGDVAGAARVAIVDRDWAREAFGGRGAVGHRIRYPERKGDDGNRWYEIVGVVDGTERAIGPGSPVAVWHPLRPEETAAVQFYLRTAGNPATLAPRVQAVVASVDPGLAAADLMPLQAVWRPVQRSDVAFMVGLAIVSAIILLFALMGIYALMSFTVAQREREIGIRAALGANPRRIVASIFSRALWQLGLGIVAGAALVSLTVADDADGRRLVAAVAAAMVVVGLAGCLLPARRALRIQPTDALRAE